MTMLGFPCVTARYAAFGRGQVLRLTDGSELQPVRTSMGNPRFLPQSAEWPRAELLVPWGLRQYERAEFQAKYRARLDKHGVDKIRRVLRAIWHQHGERPLALLCFEDLARGDWCHRRMFVAWWLEQTGEELHEFGDDRHHPEQLGLL
jgi:hypothetical protein